MRARNDKAVKCVMKINAGIKPTEDERRFLGELEEYKHNLRDSPVSSLKFLSFFTNLKEFRLEDGTVGSLKELGRLRKLQTLSLRNSQIESPEGLSDLKNLQELDLSGSTIGSLKELGRLVKLQTLSLNKTQLTDFEELRELKNLRALDLSESQISSLDSLKTLVNLKKLNLSGTELDLIPEWLVDRGLPFISNEEDFKTDSGVYMKGVRLSKQPVGLFSQNRETIKAYYKEERAPVNEAKVIFLGHGGVGKSYTIKRIVNNGNVPEDTATTPGVSVSQYCRAKKATINFWDFGGQEIMYSAHSCFLTERTCYVVVVSNRWSDITRQARRWLKVVDSFASDSKVILAVNRWEGVSAWDLDSGRLRREFPNLVDVVEYTANGSEEKSDFNKLARRIEEVVDALPSVGMTLPKSWIEIMTRLREMKDSSGNSVNYISNKVYRGYCKAAGLKANDISLWLLELSNDLGVCFSYHKKAEEGSELRNYVLLNPKWLTNAVYVFFNNCERKARNGRITHKELRDVLNDPKKICIDPELKYDPKVDLKFVLEIMRRFRLSFRIASKEVDASEEVEFIPALCPNITPVEAISDENENKTRVRCEIRYSDYLPDSVVHCLMRACPRELNPEKCWRKGLLIDKRGFLGLRAVCDMGKDDNILYIDVCQTDEDSVSKPQKLLRFLLNQLDEINNYLNLKATIWICSKDGKAAFPLTSLIEASKNGRERIPNTEGGGYTEYKIQELLEQILDEPIKIQSSGSCEDETTRLGTKKIIERYASARSQAYIEENPFLKSISISSKELDAQYVISKTVSNMIGESLGYRKKEFVDILQMMRELRNLPDSSKEQKKIKKELIKSVERVLNEPNADRRTKEKGKLSKKLGLFGKTGRIGCEVASNILNVINFV